MDEQTADGLVPGEEVSLSPVPLPPDDGSVAALGVSEGAETYLRNAIAVTKHAIVRARSAGYVVDLPFPETALDAIAISETAKVNA